MRRLHIDHAWIMRGLCVEYLWLIYMNGLRVGYEWIVRGLCMDCAWVCADYV